MGELANVSAILERALEDRNISTAEEAEIREALEQADNQRSIDSREDGFVPRNDPNGLDSNDMARKALDSLPAGKDINGLMGDIMGNQSNPYLDAEEIRLKIEKRIIDWQDQKARWDTIEQKINLKEVSPDTGLSRSVAER